MTTSMKMIIAAIGVAVLTSPVMAQQPEPHSHAAATSIARAHGSVARIHERQVRAQQVVGREPVQKTLEDYLLEDCKHNMYLSCN
jgi:hypothetical protein